MPEQFVVPEPDRPHSALAQLAQQAHGADAPRQEQIGRDRPTRPRPPVSAPIPAARRAFAATLEPLRGRHHGVGRTVSAGENPHPRGDRTTTGISRSVRAW